METVDFHHFLERMRNPAAADLVRSIKSFVISFQSSPPDPEKDSRSVQEFMSNMEDKFRVHTLWSGATDEEIESAGEGLEKYLMTKLHNRAFASISDDVEHDEKISEKITLLQNFIKPEHLDIPPNFRNESSWLLAQKELQKINTYKAPRDKLVCILNCCRVINNLLVNVSIASNEHTPGADDFLPVLIYVTIKANPPQLHLNLLYIQRYRHHSRLVSEASYFYTNLVSAESFIEHLDASSISMVKNEFEYAMQEARETMHGAKSYSHAAEQLTSIDTSQSIQVSRSEKRETPLPAETTDLTSQTHDQVDAQSSARHTAGTLTATLEKPRLKQSVANLEGKGAVAVLDANRTGRLAKEFPFLYANVGDLRVADVESLLLEYKELALRYYSLCKAIEDMPHLETQANPSQKNDLHGALNDDNRKSEAASQHETSMNLAESDLEQMKLLPKDLKSASEKELDERDATSLSRDSDILDGMSIHNFTDKSQGNDTSQNLIRENMDEVGQNPPAEVTSDKNSHLSDQLIIDTATSRYKSLGEHLLENQAPLIDI